MQRYRNLNQKQYARSSFFKSPFQSWRNAGENGYLTIGYAANSKVYGRISLCVILIMRRDIHYDGQIHTGPTHQERIHGAGLWDPRANGSRKRMSLILITLSCDSNMPTVQADMVEYNQCQATLKTLYDLGIPGKVEEFTAYRILMLIHSRNRSGTSSVKWRPASPTYFLLCRIKSFCRSANP